MTIEEIVKLKVRGVEVIKFPVRYEKMGTCIFDSNGNKVLDIRGWGRLQYAECNDGAIMQDGIGEWIAEIMNKDKDNIC